MAEKPDRNPQNNPNDRKHGIAILDAVRLTMPHYPLGSDFHGELPHALKPHFEHWDIQKPAR